MRYLLLVLGLSLYAPMVIGKVQEQDPPKVVLGNDKTWAVRFQMNFPPSGGVPQPMTHISVLVTAKCEGEATVKALLHVQNFINIGDRSAIEFYDVCEKK